MARKRTTRKPKKGGFGLQDLKDLGSQLAEAALSKAQDVKSKAIEKKVLSRSLEDVGLGAPAELARRLGYGRKRKPKKGGMDFSWVGDILGNIAKPLSYGAMGIQQGLGQIGKGRGGRRGGQQLRAPAVLLPSQQMAAYY